MDTYEHYVYAYLRIDGSPYYIGKGKGHRAFDKNHALKVPERTRIVFLETNLSNIGACALERRYIAWYGRKTENGILRNLTAGGEGSCGYTISRETRAKMSAAHKARPGFSAEHKVNISKALKGKTASNETKAKFSEARKGKPKSEEHKAKIALSMRGKNLNKKHTELTKLKMRQAHQMRK